SCSRSRPHVLRSPPAEHLRVSVTLPIRPTTGPLLGARTETCRSADTFYRCPGHAVVEHQGGCRVHDLPSGSFTLHGQRAGRNSLCHASPSFLDSILHFVLGRNESGPRGRAGGSRSGLDTGGDPLRASVVTDQATGTAGMTLVERPEPEPAINDLVVRV